MTANNDVNTPVIAAIGLLSVIVLVAFTLLMEVLYYSSAANLNVERNIEQPAVELVNLQTEQEGRLASYAWVNEKKKIAAIPIDRAMDLVLADLARGKQPAKTKGAKHAKP